MSLKIMRSSTWLSKLLLVTNSSFSSCPPKHIPKLANKLMYNKYTKRPLIKKTSSLTNRSRKSGVGGNKQAQIGTVNNCQKGAVNPKLKERKNKGKVVDNKQQHRRSCQDKWENSRPERKNLANTKRIKAKSLKHGGDNENKHPRKTFHLNDHDYKSNVDDKDKSDVTQQIPANDYIDSATLSTKLIDQMYINQNRFKDNYVKTKKHKNHKGIYMWSPYAKSKKYVLKHPATGVIILNPEPANAQENEHADEVDSNYLRNNNDDRTWVSDVYKRSTSLAVDRLIKGHKIRHLSPSERKRPVFVVQKPVFKIYKKPTKTNHAISSLFLGEKNKSASKRFLSIMEYRKNGDKCPMAPQSKPKANDSDRTKFKRTDNDLTSRVIVVKVLNDPDEEVKINREQEWSVLPKDLEDEWKESQNLKSQSNLTENNSFSNQMTADQNSKPSTELTNPTEDKRNAEDNFFNVLFPSLPADPAVIELLQPPSHDPTVKIINDNYRLKSVLEASASCPNLSDRAEQRRRFDIRKAFSRGNLTSLFAELQARVFAEPKDQVLDESKDYEITEPNDQDLDQSDGEDLDTSLAEPAEVPEDMKDKTNNTTTEDVEESSQNKSLLSVVVKNDLPKKTVTNKLVKIPLKLDEEGRWTKLLTEPMNNPRQMSLKKIPSNMQIDSIVRAPPSPINKVVVVLKPKEISKAMPGVPFAYFARKKRWHPTKVVY